MKRATLLVSLFLLLYPRLFGEPVIGIYSAYEETLYGAARDRRGVLWFSLEDFHASESLDVSGDGILTAVTVAKGIRDDLLNLVEEGGRWSRDGVTLTRYRKNGRDLFSLHYLPPDLRFTFSLEKPGDPVYDVIDLIYPARQDAAAEVKAHYSDNYVVRIHQAENVLEPEKNRVDFGEALLAATVLGEPFQHLLGIRDGYDLLGNIGYLVLEQNYKKPLGMQYRPLAAHEDDINLFLMKLEEMEGDSEENLYKLAAASFQLNPPGEQLQLPEYFIRTMRGDSFDMAFFLYDILRRLGREVRFLAVASLDGLTEAEGAVVYRDGDSWRFMDYLGLYAPASPDWTRLPALVHEVTMLYREIDLTEFIETQALPNPREGDWKKSVY